MKRILLGLVWSYKKYISPALVQIFGHSCRFTPTCSDYAYQAIEKYGVLKGTGLALRRVVRCNPFTKPGYDPLIKI